MVLDSPLWKLMTFWLWLVGLLTYFVFSLSKTLTGLKAWTAFETGVKLTLTIKTRF
jgi:hypothetical protein